MKILVCGGRNYADSKRLAQVLGDIHSACPITLIIEGGALGADRLARIWANQNGVAVQTFPANWKSLGKRAGPERNARMLAEGKPQAVIAFPGGSGTADMVARAMADDDVRVWEVESKPTKQHQADIFGEAA